MSSAQSPIRLGIVGVGKIVRDQHLPALARDKDFRLVAAASRNATVDGIANFATIEEMLASDVEIDAVSLCQPPQVRHQAARAALEAGKHVFLEKPPGATVSEVEDFKALAAAKGRLAVRQLAFTLCAGGRSRADVSCRDKNSFGGHRLEGGRAPLASEPGLDLARRRFWRVRSGHQRAVDRDAHPAADVRDLLYARFSRKPRRADRSQYRLPDVRRPAGAAVFDWRQTGPQTWNITADTDAGQMLLSSGGAKLAIDGRIVHEEPEAEYPMLYRRFAEIVRSGESDADVAPLQQVADAFMLGKRNVVEAFFD